MNASVMQVILCYRCNLWMNRFTSNRCGPMSDSQRLRRHELGQSALSIPGPQWSYSPSESDHMLELTIRDESLPVPTVARLLSRSDSAFGSFAASSQSSQRFFLREIF